MFLQVFKTTSNHLKSNKNNRFALFLDSPLPLTPFVYQLHLYIISSYISIQFLYQLHLYINSLYLYYLPVNSCNSHLSLKLSLTSGYYLYLPRPPSNYLKLPQLPETPFKYIYHYYLTISLLSDYIQLYRYYLTIFNYIVVI